MRLYFFLALMFLFAGCQMAKNPGSGVKLTETVSSLYDPEKKPFYHGVASGDPLTDRVIIWTRVTPEDSLSSIEVSWEVATNDQFAPVLKNASVTTSPARDYTVKVDVDGLDANTQYYYRFKALEKISPAGRTKTLPEGSLDSLKFAVVSCSNWQHGYFNAYDRIASKDVDVVLHLGDYIYEYGINNAKNVDRRHLPEHEIVTLADYRTRYSQYHLDNGLRKMRQQHPIITIWDDHEVANDTYAQGAQNHQPEEGDFAARKAAARKAYHEWIPIREADKHYRTFSFGNLADLIMLDERQEGKTKPAQGIADPIYKQDDRSMLGKTQLNWFESKLENSTAIWKVIGNQVMFSDLDRAAVSPKNPRNMDSWDGYPAEKQKVADIIQNKMIRNIIFLTGDTHASWAFEVVASPLKPTKKDVYQPLAVEFGTTSVSSTNSNESMPDDTVKLREEAYLKTNPHLKFVNQRDHGYLLLTLYTNKAKAEWFFVRTILQPDERETLAKTLQVNLNSNTLR
ncbi:MAG: alkaline phosphatase D family protein [Cyclobacteriaceae bacterium]